MIIANQFMMQYPYSKQTLTLPSLEIKPGQCIVICGKSGCGKTSFLRLLNGLIPDYYPAELTGELRCQNLCVGKATVEEMSYQIASVFQNPATQFFNRKVIDELVFPCENHGVNPSEIEQRLDKVCNYLQLEDLLEKDLLKSSGGQRQKVAFATAMMQNPQILLLDEPTANLDQEGIQMMKEQILLLKQTGMTIIVAEHRLNFLAECADRYLYFDEGQLSEIWTSKQFLDLSSKERCQLGLRQSRLPDITELVSTNNLNGELLVKDLTIGFQKTALAYIKEMSFKRGQVTGIVGRNGIGKTTFIHHLAGLTNSLSGEYYLKDQQLTKEERLKKTAIVLQEPRLQLFAETVEKELRLGANDFTLYDTLVARFQLEELLQQHPMTLSGGQQQRVVIANALMSDKEIIVLDEPTSGLDYEQMMQVSSLLSEVKEMGKIIIIVSHDEEFLATTCDEIKLIS